MGAKTKNSHLNLNERKIIEHMLDENRNFQFIAEYLCKSPTTISREVFSRRTVNKNKFNVNSVNLSSKCKRYNSCNIKNICGRNCDMPEALQCRKCYLCTDQCQYYVPITCAKISKTPYVCNACSQKIKCHYDKYFYHGDAADKSYKKKLSESRQVLAIDLEQRKKLSALIAPLIKNGQSIMEIQHTHPEWFQVCISTVYGYIEDGLLPGITAMDLIEKVQRKHHTKRRKTMIESKTLSKSRKHRTYTDFLKYVEASKTSHIWELDTVMGRKGDTKSIMTLISRESRFMFGFLLDHHTFEAVIEVFDSLELKLGFDLFRELFPVILTDNGVEFMEAEAIEQSITNEFEVRTRIFYCDPNNPNQKAIIERNHEFLRRVIPKGHSIQFLRQQEVNLVMNHINSYKRDSTNWDTPYALFLNHLKPAELIRLNVRCIEPDQVILKPKLLSERKKQYQAELRQNN